MAYLNEGQKPYQPVTGGFVRLSRDELRRANKKYYNLGLKPKKAPYGAIEQQKLKTE